ncbi:MAG: pyroglutamyl-peptidase I [Acholeplasmataceae bacterium]
MKILLTGFEPFGNQKVNVSYEAIKGIDTTLFDAQLIKACVPTVFHQSIDYVKELILKHQPDIICLIGEAGGSQSMLLERVAINMDDARIPDNLGNQPIDQVIVVGGQNAYFSTLPIKACLKDLKEKDIKATISNSAGTYVCNHLMYGVLEFLDQTPALSHIKAGFIHVPLYEDQVKEHPDQPYMPLKTIIYGLETVINTFIKHHL